MVTASTDLPTASPSPAGAAPIGVPAVLDMEASGFGRDGYPIEVGYVLADGSSRCTLIRPAAHWTHWDADAQRAHGISRDLLQRHGRSVGDVAQWLNDELHGMTLYSDGWANDYTWLGMLFEAADMSPSFKLDNLRALLTDAEAELWHVVKEQVGREMRVQRHRASADARLLQRTLMRFRMPLPD